MDHLFVGGWILASPTRHGMDCFRGVGVKGISMYIVGAEIEQGTFLTGADG